MPNRRLALVVLLLPIVSPVLLPVAARAAAPDLSWYVESLCPDDGLTCTTEEVVYGQCLHVPNGHCVRTARRSTVPDRGRKVRSTVPHLPIRAPGRPPRVTAWV